MTNGNLFKAIDILKNYVKEDEFNFHCEHDVLWINVKINNIPDKDLFALYDLGVFDDEENGTLKAYVSC